MASSLLIDAASRFLQAVSGNKQKLPTDVKDLRRSLESSNGLLAGTGPEQSAIDDWIAFASTLLAEGGDKPSLLQRLDTSLLTCTFLVGNRLTLADVLVFAALQVHTKGDAGGVSSLLNVCRWASHVQSLSGVRGVLPALPVSAKPVSLAFDYERLQSASVASSGTKAGAGAGAGAGAPAAKKEDKRLATTPAQPQPSKDNKSQAQGTQEKGKDKAGDKDKSKGKEKESKESKAPAKAASTGAGAGVGAGGEASAACSRLDVRVGRVVSCRPHATEPSRMLTSLIEVGRAEPLQVVSGLAAHLAPDQFKGALVCVVVNLPEAEVKGEKSAGRVLVATGKDGQKEVVAPPAQAPVGEMIRFQGAKSEPDARVAPKNWHKIEKGLHTNAYRHAQFEAYTMVTSAGPCTVPSIADATIA